MDYQASRKLIFRLRDPVVRRLLLQGLCEDSWRTRKADRPRYGALTRRGTPCQAPAVHDGRRCRIHGGLSTGPNTDEGREAIRASNRQRAQGSDTSVE